MKRQVLQSDFDKAVTEIKNFLNNREQWCKTLGYDYYPTPEAPESYKQLKICAAESKRIPIADYGSDTSIYGKDYNTKFRFYHDTIHLLCDLDFSLEGETRTAEIHKADGQAFGLSPLALEILWYDTAGQIQYYYRHKKFINSQLDFIWNCLNYGLQKALGFKI